MSEPPRDDKADEPTGSAPWERPRRWNDPRLDATRVDDLLARLGNEDEQSGRRHRRGSNKVAASDLIAALQGSQPAPGTDPTNTDASSTTPTSTDAPAANAERATPPAADQDLTETIRRPQALDPSGHITPLTTVDPDATAVRALGLSVTPSSLPRSPRVTPLPTSLPSLTAPPPLSSAQQPPSAPSSLSTPPPVSPPAGPGIVSVPGGEDSVTEQIPKFGPSEDVGSIRESLRQQHFGPGDQQGTAIPDAVAGAIGAGAGTAAAGPTQPGSHAATGPAAAASATRRASQRRRTSGLMIAGRSAIAVLSAVLLVYVGLQWNLIQSTNAGLRANGGAYLATTDPNISAPSTASSTATETGPAKPVVPAAVPQYKAQNILLLGSDTRSGANGNSGNSNGQQSTAQSDTVMIAHVSGDRQHVTILSIPRDLRVKAPTCRTWDSTTGKVSDTIQPVNATSTWKITNAYAVGGPACTVLAVQKLTGLRLDQLIGIDFVGFKTMVDALHGVTVNICRPITDKTLGVVVLNGGVQTIQGDQALNLVRAREVIGDSSGDYGRIHRQQVVLSAMLRQVTSAGTLLNQSKLSDFLDAFVHATFTDNVNVDSLVELSHQLGNLSPGKVTFYTLPTHPNPADNGDSQLADAIDPAVFGALVNDELLPGQTNGPTTSKSSSSTASSTTSSALTSAQTSTLPTPQVPTTTAPSSTAPQTISVDPADIDLEIDNLTGKAGVAGKVADTLNGYGFKVPTADLVRPNQTQTAINVQYSSGNRNAAAVVAAAVPGSTLTLAPALGKKVKLVLGTSYAGSLTKVAVGQALPSRLQTTPVTTSSSPAAPSSSSSPTSRTPAAAHPSSTQKTAPGVRSSDIASVNAAQTDCA
ncbi:MAG: LCP family protein [Actinomycetota bacterium]|nr:LCP family protein [Actinomycetota bacterium]